MTYNATPSTMVREEGRRGLWTFSPGDALSHKVILRWDARRLFCVPLKTLFAYGCIMWVWYSVNVDNVILPTIAFVSCYSKINFRSTTTDFLVSLFGVVYLDEQQSQQKYQFIFRRAVQTAPAAGRAVREWSVSNYAHLQDRSITSFRSRLSPSSLYRSVPTNLKFLCLAIVGFDCILNIDIYTPRIMPHSIL